MSRQTRGPAAIARLASELTGDYDPQLLLQDICDQAVASMDLALASLVVLHDNQTILLASSSPVALDEMSDQLSRTGPAREAAWQGAVSMADDIRIGQHRWAEAAELMTALGLSGARGFPLRLAGSPVGSLTLYTADAWGEGDSRSSVIGQTLADLAVLALTQDRRGTSREISFARLIAFLAEERTVIYQAQGMVAEAAGVSIDAAISRLAQYAQQAGTTVGLVASQIVSGHLDAGAVDAG